MGNEQESGRGMRPEHGIMRRGTPFLAIIGIVLAVCLCLFAYKKTAVDYSGEYATDRLVYTEEYGMTMLITYHPQYQEEKSKGYAIVHIPVSSFFSDRLRANKSGNDMADAKDLLDGYKSSEFIQGIVTGFFGVLGLGDAEQQSFLRTKRSFTIGKYGDYYVVDGRHFCEKQSDVSRASNPTKAAKAPKVAEVAKDVALMDSIRSAFSDFDGVKADFDRVVEKYGPCLEYKETDFKNRYTDGQIDQIIEMKLQIIECRYYKVNVEPAQYMLTYIKVGSPIGIPKIDRLLGLSMMQLRDECGDRLVEKDGCMYLIDSRGDGDVYYGFHLTDGFVDSVSYYPFID